MSRTRYTIVLGVALLAVAVAIVLKYATRSTPRIENPHSSVVLVSAKELRPALGDDVPFASEDFMLIRQSEDAGPSITEPVAEVRASNVIEHNCGTISVRISGNGAITLNNNDVGTICDTSALKATITDAFNVRVTQRAYLPGMERRTDLPDIERIPRTVLLSPSSSVAVQDVVAILDLLKELSAKPIGLRIDHLPS
jgi:biopolymer transport protein ExbD